MNYVTGTANTILSLSVLGAAIVLLFTCWESYATSNTKDSWRSAIAGNVVHIPGPPAHHPGKMLVLALSANCRFCSDRAPFYRRLADQASRRHDIRLVVTLPQSVDEGRSNLRSLGLDSIEVSRSDQSSIVVVGTPTLLLLDEDSRVQAAWLGRLSSNMEKEALRRIFGNTLPEDSSSTAHTNRDA
jgi:hypothetical protein